MDKVSNAFQLAGEHVVKSLGSSSGGLSSGEASARLSRDGRNELFEKPGKSDLDLFLGQFANSLIITLIAAAAISFLMSLEVSLSPFHLAIGSLTEVLDAAAIMAIVILNAAFGFVQERNAARAIGALKKMMAPSATVLRDGEKRRIPARELVAGDVILLDEGDRVPADCRLLEVRNLEVDESALTGESMPVSKESAAIRAERIPLAERKNMAFMSTIVTRGKATAIVVSTGMGTEMGKISDLVQAVGDESTPLQEKLEIVARNLGYVALAISLVVFGLGVAQGKGLFDMFLTTVSIAVAAIPEGLPAIVTLSLALGVQRMAKKNAIIRRLPACETLGGATVICTDKTGTLTKNEMTVRKVYAAGQHFEVSGNGYSEDGRVLPAGKNAPAAFESNCAYKQTVICSVACNNAKLAPSVAGRNVGIIGDPMEAALLVLGRKAGQDRDALELEYMFVDENPFDSTRKMMSMLWRNKDGGCLFVKGAPERVIFRCTHYLDASGKERQMTPAEAERLLSVNRDYASRALRVLGFAYKRTELRKCDETAEQGLVFTGLVGIFDPPREEVSHAVSVCRQAGIRVVMITGDNADTATAIARQVGLAGDGDEAVNGHELDSMSERQLVECVGRIAVFARVEPEHKIRIVSALKARGEVVAMTGDGVNDAPALKKADIGISMGITGTDVAKESSDMVLTDDNFASIVAAVEEGRVIYSNIVKSVRYLVSCNIGEVLVIFFALLFGFQYLPLLPLQILWMNLATDGLPALSLGSDSAEPGLMRRKPRSSDEEIMDAKTLPTLFFDGLVMAAGTLALFSWELSKGSGIDAARTVAFTTIIFFQLFHSFNMRSVHGSIIGTSPFANRKLALSFVIGVALQFALIYLPVAQEIFRTAPLPLFDVAVLFAVSASIIPIVEFRKALSRRRPAQA